MSTTGPIKTYTSHFTAKQDLSAGVRNALIPTGGIIVFGMTTASLIPDGFLKCDGSSVSRATYSKLFAVIGTTYGGSGSNFTLPTIAAPLAGTTYIIKT